ncbi:MAG: Crp/Fnr family transcriptional regulator [Clostridiales bacterium]
MDRSDLKNLFSQHFSFWEHLSDSEKETLLNSAKENHYEKGEYVQSGNQNCVGVISVKSGELRVYMLSEEGKEITLYRLFPGDTCVLSASCVLDAIAFEVFVNADEKSDVVLINAGDFRSLKENNIYVEAFAYKLATTRFSQVMWAMQQILFMTMDKRLAIFLNDELLKTKGDTIKLTHEQIAKYMGSAREVVSRMLKYFAQEGMVELSRGGIKIIDHEKLKNLI